MRNAKIWITLCIYLSDTLHPTRTVDDAVDRIVGLCAPDTWQTLTVSGNGVKGPFVSDAGVGVIDLGNDIVTCSETRSKSNKNGNVMRQELGMIWSRLVL